jgi:hypothetical protein
MRKIARAAAAKGLDVHSMSKVPFSKASASLAAD